MSTASHGPVATEMIRRLEAALAPTRLVLRDDSDAHRGHAGHSGAGESHFALQIESAAFVGQNRVQRQRAVYRALGDLMTTRVHALSIEATAPEERG